MAEAQQKKKKRKKKQLTFLEQVEEQEAQNVAQVTEVLEELEKQGKRLDIQVCPKCKSPRVRRAKTLGGDLWGNMGLLPPKYECPDCGWQANVVVKATNKPTSVKDAELMAEAKELADEEST